MSSIVCNDCGTENELPIVFHSMGEGEGTFFYCRGCANRVPASDPDASRSAGSEAESPAAGGSGELLDELLGLPLAPQKPLHAINSQPVSSEPREGEQVATEPSTSSSVSAVASLEQATFASTEFLSGEPSAPAIQPAESAPSPSPNPEVGSSEATAPPEPQWNPATTAGPATTAAGPATTAAGPATTAAPAATATSPTTSGPATTEASATAAGPALATRPDGESWVGANVSQVVGSEPVQSASSSEAKLSPDEKPLEKVGLSVPRPSRAAPPIAIKPGAFKNAASTPPTVIPTVIETSGPHNPEARTAAASGPMPLAQGESGGSAEPARMSAAESQFDAARGTASSAALASEWGEAIANASMAESPIAVGIAAPPPAEMPPLRLAPVPPPLPESAAIARPIPFRRDSVDELSWDVPPVEPIPVTNAQAAAQTPVVAIPTAPSPTPTGHLVPSVVSSTDPQLIEANQVPPSVAAAAAPLVATADAMDAASDTASGLTLATASHTDPLSPSGEAVLDSASAWEAPSEVAVEARPPENVSAKVPTAPVVVPLPGRGRSAQPTLPFGIPVPGPNDQGGRDAASGGALDTGSFAALLDREAEKFPVVYTPEAPATEAASGPAQPGDARSQHEGTRSEAPALSGSTMPAARPIVTPTHPGSLLSAQRPTSDAPTVQSWVPPELQPSRFKRFAPLGVAMTAVVIAFVVGREVGKSNPRAPAAAAAEDRPSTVRAREPAKVAAPAPAPAAPTSADAADRNDEPPPARAAVRGGSSTRAFNAKTAGQVVGQAGYRARGCKKPGNPGGTIVATVTFAPSGRVEDVAISGARIAGTPMANCIVATLRSARLLPFAGQAQTVKKNLRFD